MMTEQIRTEIAVSRRLIMRFLIRSAADRRERRYFCLPVSGGPGPSILAAIVLFLLPFKAQAQIGTPVDLGKNTIGINGPQGTVSMTTTAAAPAGGSIIVMASDTCIRSCPFSSVSCSDSAGNAYTTDLAAVAGGVNFPTICSTHHLAAALPAGSTITATFNLRFGAQSLIIHAISVTGLTSVPLDQTASAQGIGPTPSSGNAATTTAGDELLIGEIEAEQLTVANAGFTPGSGYTALAPVDGLASESLFGEFKIVSATGVYAADGTFAPGTTSGWGALLATYKAVPFIHPPLTVVANPASLSLASGQSGQVSLTITGNGSNAVSVQCAPVTVSCSVSTPVVGANSTTATLTIDARSSLARNTPPASSGLDHSALAAFGMMLPATLLVVPLGSRSKKTARGRRIGTVLGLLLLMVVLINGCGGHPSTPHGVPAGNYSVTVTATSGSVTANTNVSVTVH